MSDLTSEAVDRCAPDFVVCPDRVAGGLDSLEFSRLWLERCESLRPGLRYYLAVQNGMTHDDVSTDGFAGIFVGGDLPWKIATGESWVRFAHDRHLPCHIGRVGTAKRVYWARRIGADSIDSCLPLWSADNLRTFVQALASRQLEMF